MKVARSLFRICVAVLMAVFGQFDAAAKVIYVTTPEGFVEAYAAAESDDVLDLAYEGEWVISSTIELDKSIVIRGRNPQVTSITGLNVTAFSIPFGVVVVIENLSFINSGSSSGAIFVDQGQLELTNCIFSGNTTDQGGGAIYLKSGTGKFYNCSFIGNESVFGGSAIKNSGGFVKVVQCTFHDNLAHGANGGAIEVINSGRLEMSHSTLCNNRWETLDSDSAEASRASAGLAATKTDTIDLTYNLISNNFAEYEGVLRVANLNKLVAGKVGLRLFSDNFMETTNAAIAQLGEEFQLKSTDPLVSTKLTYGFGQTPVLLLDSSSPAIDLIPEDFDLSKISHDQRGYPRILKGKSTGGFLGDYGAVEMPGIYVTTTADQGGGSLRAAIQAANEDASPDVIAFAIPGNSGNSDDYQIINLMSELPAIAGPVLIDGFSQRAGLATEGLNWKDGLIGLHNQAAVNWGLFISAAGFGSTVKGLGFTAFPITGIYVAANKVEISANRFGTNPITDTSTDSLAAGVLVVSSGNLIGGGTSIAANYFSHCVSGILIRGQEASGNRIYNNAIGGEADNGEVHGNHIGVTFGFESSANELGGYSNEYGNVLTGNTMADVIIDSLSHHNLVQGNDISWTSSGASTGSESSIGIQIGNGANNNTVGLQAEDTVPSNYGDAELTLGNNIGNVDVGIRLYGTGTDNNVIAGNSIGVSNTVGAVTNKVGIKLDGGASSNEIGGIESRDENRINGSLIAGVQVIDDASRSNRIIGNAIYNLTGIPILLDSIQHPIDSLDADDGPNGLQNQPTLASISICNDLPVIVGTLLGEGGASYRLDFYRSNDQGEAVAHLGKVLLPSEIYGLRQIAIVVDSNDVISVGDQIVVTATNEQTMDTSPLSNVVTVTDGTLGAPNVSFPGILSYKLCAGDTVTIDASISGGVAPYVVYFQGAKRQIRTFEEPGGVELVLSPMQTTTYSLFKIVDAAGCLLEGGVSFDVIVNNPQVSNQVSTYCPNDPVVTFSPELIGSTEMQWFDDPALKVEVGNGFEFTQDSAFIDVNGDGTYYAHAGAGGCYDRSVTMQLVPTPENCNVQEIQTHRAFSPNADGLNDTWMIDGIGSYPMNHLVILDSWGNTVASFTNYNNSTVVWGGQNKDGTISPFGTYYYRLELSDDQVLQGWVQLTP